MSSNPKRLLIALALGLGLLAGVAACGPVPGHDAPADGTAVVNDGGSKDDVNDDADDSDDAEDADDDADDSDDDAGDDTDDSDDGSDDDADDR
ncbi:DNA primase [Bifidobacterium myosotis]|uniref:DNA primase n=1 Tax=Bifidobacterium myosotis TaxID=1630166 RepID=A0A5M9ZLD0_9BIFI|nr:DNA primase [Bifidobacterium myosotis]KAA8828123.1 DNA primase [Bifidobacterium myosotis]